MSAAATIPPSQLDQLDRTLHRPEGDGRHHPPPTPPLDGGIDGPTRIPIPSSTHVPSSSTDDDPLYNRLITEALQAERAEPSISNLLRRTILAPHVTNFNEAIAATISHRLVGTAPCGGDPTSTPDIAPTAIRTILLSSLDSPATVLDHTTSDSVRADMSACVERDPACLTLLEPLLFYKGFAALVLHRAARHTWGRPTRVPGVTSKFVSYWLQSQASAKFGVDIHPAATIGAGIMLDHATGIVIGETAVVGDGCSILHGVTLGGTGKDKHKDRHPKVGKDVLLGAGTSVLGNLTIGDGCKVGAGSVVLQPIPHGATAVGAPAKVVGRAKESKPGTENDTMMRGVVPVHFRRHRKRAVGGGHNTASAASESPNPLDRRRSKSVGSVDEQRFGFGDGPGGGRQERKGEGGQGGGVHVDNGGTGGGGEGREDHRTILLIPPPTSSSLDRSMSGPAASGRYVKEEEEEAESLAGIRPAGGEGEALLQQQQQLDEKDPDGIISDGSDSGDDGSGGDEEEQKLNSEKKRDNSSSSDERIASARIIRKGTCLDATMCIWRNFGAVDPPPGTLNIYQLRRLLENEGATESEIGEVFFALVEDTPYIPECDLRERFPEVAGRYCKSIDCECYGRILDCMREMASSPRRRKKKEEEKGTRERERSDSFSPEDFYSSDASEDNMGNVGAELPTIDSNSSFQ